MSPENVETFYDDVIAAIRASLTGISNLPWSPPPTIDQLKHQEALIRPEGGKWMRFDPSEEQPYYAGFRLVDIARLGDFVLIAFQWPETGDQIFVHTANLRILATQKCPVQWAEAIITTNLLEKLGGEWYQQYTLRHIKGLTFIE